MKTKQKHCINCKKKIKKGDEAHLGGFIVCQKCFKLLKVKGEKDGRYSRKMYYY